MKILVVEDEKPTATFLGRGLSEEGYAVDVVESGQKADEAVFVNRYDLIVLDVMLPGVDGFTLCRRWREQGLKCPVLFLTGRDAIQDRVQGLDAGGDDYLVKPFAFEELLARLRALARRQVREPSLPELVAGPLRLDPNKRQADCHGERLDLTPKEYAILEALVRRRGQIVSRTLLWESVWESHSEPSSNVVDVNVGYLRKKLGPYSEMIKTVRGAGYLLDEAD
ncbi:MAG: response regulator transcription factor [Candidatus Eremiobacteraeota bacterium]|nr:response regulator transcription factor [Candidatus Eremiobacteraeota bacterium]